MKNVRMILAAAAIVAAVSCGADDKKGEADAASLRDAASDPDVATGGDGGGPDGGSAADLGADVGGDVTAPDMGLEDSGVFVPSACGTDLVADTTFLVDDSGVGGQLYARAAWDGRGAWVVYNRPQVATSGPEAIFAARLGCDGEVELGPMRVSNDDTNRTYYPQVSSRNGVTHIIWISQPEGENPKFVHLKSFDADGQELFAGVADITPSGTFEPVSGLIWEPDVATYSDGSGIVVVSAGGFGEFQIFAQRFARNGATEGPAISVYTEKGVDQRRPSVGVSDDDTAFVSWIRNKPEDAMAGTPEEPDLSVFVTIPDGAIDTVPEAPMPAKPLVGPNETARFAKEEGPSGEMLLAFQVDEGTRADILVRDGAMLSSAAVATYGTSGYVNFRPSVAGGSEIGVLAWYRFNQTPLKNEIVLAPVLTAGGLAAGPEATFETDAPGIPPYGPAITPVGGRTYFVAWAEGDQGPLATVKGRFVAF